MLYWTGFAYYAYITLVPDLIVVPIIKGMVDRTMSRKKEYEADFQALYLLKRAGYDPNSMITTLSLLPDLVGKDEYEILSKTKEIVAHHPRNDNRVAHLQKRMFDFEKDFKSHYEIKSQPSTTTTSSSAIEFVLSFAKRIFTSV